MMMGRLGRVAVLALVVAVGGSAVTSAQLRPAANRADVIEVGEPIIISRDVLKLEMQRNIELREYVELYGWPEYAEVQEVQVQEPFAPYEVRLYYLRRDQYLAFGRVHVAPSVYDYGVVKYEGAISEADLNRLLTAQPTAAQAAEAPSEPPSQPPPPAKMDEQPEQKKAEAVEPEVEPMVMASAEVEPVPVPPAPSGDLEATIQRLEAAADRAAAAADDAERASTAAKNSAERATTTLDRVIEAQQAAAEHP
jgi:hypothetical protein